MKRRMIWAFVCFLPLGLLAARAGDLPADDAAQPVEVVHTGDYTEGVVVDHQGNLYISHGKIITKVDAQYHATLWAETGAPNGHKILADGTHLVCDASRHAVLHLDPAGKELPPASKESEGKPLRGPNDLTLDPKGGFYFTDPGDSGLSNPIGTVHYVDLKGVTHTAAKGLAFPNGTVLRPDGKELLVGESQKNRVLAFKVTSPGVLEGPRTLVDLPLKGPGQIANEPDGMTLDAEGNLYVAHYGMRQVQVISPAGKVIRRYPGGNLTTSNVCFAGPAMDRLYMTGGDPGGLFRLDLKGVKGLVILPPNAAPAAAPAAP